MTVTQSRVDRRSYIFMQKHFTTNDWLETGGLLTYHIINISSFYHINIWIFAMDHNFRSPRYLSYQWNAIENSNSNRDLNETKS